MRLYKLTDQDGYTRRGKHNETLWGEGVSHTSEGCGNKLCTADLIHAYTSPYMAVLMNCRHANLSNPKLWLAKGKVVNTNHQLKCGVKTLTTIKQIELPTITIEQRVEIAIRCSLKVYIDPKYILWAKNWLSGKDRSKTAAGAAYADAYAAATVAAVADAADYATYAADAYTTYAANAYANAYAANAYATYAVAAFAAATAADAAADAIDAPLNILSIINRVIHS